MEKKYKLTDEMDTVYWRQFFNFLIDNILSVYISSKQVPKKHFKHIAGRLPKQSFHRQLKALTHCMQQTYSDIVGCGYAIQYPLWEKHNDGLCAVFLSTRHLLGCLLRNL